MRSAEFFKLGLAGLALATSTIGATRADDIVVEPQTFPAPFYEPTGSPEAVYRLDNVLEASGVQPIGDGRLLLVAHDKKVSLRVIDTATGRQVGPQLTSDRFPAETPKSSKWEGMAQDSEGNYYAIGSHSGKTQGERDEHAKLIRFRLKSLPATDGHPSAVAVDDGSVISWRLATPLVHALEHEGLATKAVDERKIEGLAVRELPGGPDAGPAASWSSVCASRTTLFGPSRPTSRALLARTPNCRLRGSLLLSRANARGCAASSRHWNTSLPGKGFWP
jgi:hypothetical protein